MAKDLPIVPFYPASRFLSLLPWLKSKKRKKVLRKNLKGLM